MLQFDFCPNNGLIISAQTPEDGTHFPRNGGTAFAINHVTGHPVIHMHRDAKARPDEHLKLNQIKNDGILFITGHGLKRGNTLSGTYVDLNNNDGMLNMRWRLSEYVNLVLDNAPQLKIADHLFIVLWNCQAGAEGERSIAYKIAEQFLARGIHTTILAHPKNMNRFNGKYEKNHSLRFDTSNGAPPKVFQSSSEGIAEFDCSGPVFFNSRGISFTRGFNPVARLKQSSQRQLLLGEALPAESTALQTIKLAYISALMSDPHFHCIDMCEASVELSTKPDGSFLIHASPLLAHHYSFCFTVSYKHQGTTYYDRYTINTKNKLVHKILEDSDHSKLMQLDPRSPLIPQINALYIAQASSTMTQVKIPPAIPEIALTPMQDTDETQQKTTAAPYAGVSVVLSDESTQQTDHEIDWIGSPIPRQLRRRNAKTSATDLEFNPESAPLLSPAEVILSDQNIFPTLTLTSRLAKFTALACFILCAAALIVSTLMLGSIIASNPITLGILTVLIVTMPLPIVATRTYHSWCSNIAIAHTTNNPFTPEPELNTKAASRIKKIRKLVGHNLPVESRSPMTESPSCCIDTEQTGSQKNKL